MIFEYVASSFWLTALLLCALFYADYALTIWGQRLYFTKARELQEHEAYELNPIWREAVEQERFWTPRLLFGLARMIALAGCLSYVGWSSRLTMGQATVWLWYADGLLWFRDALLATGLSRSLILIGLHIRNIVLYLRYLTPEHVRGKSTFDATYSYGVSRITALTAALPFLVLAVFEPSPITVGFLLGPLVLALNISRMARRNRRQAAAQTQSPEGGE